MSVGSVKVVSHLFESLAAGDIDAMVANFHPDIVVKEADNLPFGGLHQGVKAFREDLLGGIAAGADLVVSDREMMDTGGDVVVVRMIGTFTSKHTGRTVRMPMVELWKVEDGQITEIDVFYKDVTEMAKLYEER
ncbi:nuclear transport factor 2 family protein [Mycolicibacterium vinylchloridicum]|uniref:nuclear transport factor 2 family protein n=1 Tax=Mycolicibacterium vinylchloridicum TaxID=2736928 RepID=UPI0015CB8BC3|nr:nuclear transport factor 2 family protein [Mycolicibacterium vinylchloridicum]